MTYKPIKSEKMKTTDHPVNSIAQSLFLSRDMCHALWCSPGWPGDSRAQWSHLQNKVTGQGLLNWGPEGRTEISILGRSPALTIHPLTQQVCGLAHHLSVFPPFQATIWIYLDWLLQQSWLTTPTGVSTVLQRSSIKVRLSHWYICTTSSCTETNTTL